MERDALLDLANSHLECGDYSAAICEFRELALAKEPTADVLNNLATAELLDRITYRKLLVATHTDSSLCKLELARSFLKSTNSTRAHVLSSEFLAEVEENSKLAIELRLIRLNAAIKAHQYQTFSEDWIELWNLSTATKGASGIKRVLLRTVIELSDAKSVEALDQICQGLELPKLKRLIEQKISSLIELEQLLRFVTNEVHSEIDLSPLDVDLPNC